MPQQKKKFTVKESEYCPRRLKNTKPQKKELKDKEWSPYKLLHCEKIISDNK